MSTLNWQKSIKKYIEDIVIITAIPTGMPLVAANIEPLKSFSNVIGIMKRTVGILGSSISKRLTLNSLNEMG